MFGLFKSYSEQGLIHHWSLDETTGSVVTDRIGAETGTATNMENGDWEAGKIGNALHFDGVDESVIMSDVSTVSSLTTLTVAAWVNFDIVPPAGTLEIICAKASSFASDYEFALYYSDVGADEGFLFGINGNSSDTEVSGATPATVSTWHHVCGVYDGSNMHIYLDGSSDATPVARTAATPNTALSLRIGSRTADSNPLDGLIDDVRVYNRALTATEVAGLAALGV